MDTLCAQGFTANKMLVGRTLQRGILILGLTMLPCMALYMHMTNMLLLFRIDPAIANLTGRYILLNIPALPPMFLSTLLERYLQAQDIVYPTLCINMVCVMLTLLVKYLLLNVWAGGLDGSAYSGEPNFHPGYFYLVYPPLPLSRYMSLAE